MSHDSSSIEIEVYNNGKTCRLLKLLFFVYKCAGILVTSIYITQRVLATPTLIFEFYLNHSQLLDRLVQYLDSGLIIRLSLDCFMCYLGQGVFVHSAQGNYACRNTLTMSLEFWSWKNWSGDQNFC